MAIEPSGNKAPSNLEQFLQLPKGVQDHITTFLSEKEVFDLVSSNPKLFLDNLATLPKLGSKFYNYFFNNKVFRELRGGPATKPESQAGVVKWISSIFFGESEKPKPTVLTLEDALHTSNVQNYLTRLNLSGLNEKEIGFILSNLPADNHIESIELTGAEITPEQFEQLIDKCPNLKHLSVHHNPILKKIDPAIFQRLENLESLNLSYSDISEKTFLELIQHTPALKHLDVAGNHSLTNKAMGSIGALKHLESLDISNTNFSPEALTQLSQLTELRHLGASHMKGLNEMFFLALSQLNHLNSLNLSHSSLEENTGFRMNQRQGASIASASTLLRGLAHLEHIEHLNLSGNQGWTWASFDGLAHLPLRSLVLDGTDIGPQELEKLAKVAPNIEHLSLQDCGKFLRTENLSFVYTFAYFKNIQDVQLGHRDTYLNPDRLDGIINNSPKLKQVVHFSQ